MVNKYFDLIDQSYYFPQESFDLEKDELIFNGIPVMNLIEKYGTPFKSSKFILSIGLFISTSHLHKIIIN